MSELNKFIILTGFFYVLPMCITVFSKIAMPERMSFMPWSYAFIPTCNWGDALDCLCELLLPEQWNDRDFL